MKLISSKKDYAKEMDERVIPYLKARMESGMYERIPGQSLYYEHFRADEPKASIVLVHGFTEAIVKFYETVYYFLTEGFHVWLFQQREHGKSFRSTTDPNLVNIEHYEDLILDLNGFVTEKVKKDPDTGKMPLYLFGHSMGGGVSGCYLERFPDDFEKAVLSSPMMDINSGSIPGWAAWIYSKLMILMGKERNYIPGAMPFSSDPDFENSCSNCRERYLYWFYQQLAHREYQMRVSGIRTASEFLKLTSEVTAPENCSKVKAKVLLLQAGRDTVVNPGGQNKFISRIGSLGKKVVMPKAKHEIYLCSDRDLKEYWKTILEFLRGEGQTDSEKTFY